MTDSFTKQKKSILSINTVHENGTKLNLNFDVGYPFFDIKLDNTHNFTFYLNNLADKEIFPSHYEILKSIQLFDSETKFDFMRVYFLNHTERQNALKKIKYKTDSKLKFILDENNNNIEKDDW